MRTEHAPGPKRWVPTYAERLSATDVNARLSGSVTDTATGMQADITGNWSATDPDQYPHIIWTLPIAVDPARSFIPRISVIERTPPDSLSADIYIGAALVNESTISSVTCDFAGGGLLYTGGARKARSVRATDGSPTLVNSTNSPATMRIAQAAILCYGTDGRFFNVTTQCLDVNGASIGGTTSDLASATASPLPQFGTFTHLVAWIGRTSTTDVTTRTVAFQVALSYGLGPGVHI